MDKEMSKFGYVLILAVVIAFIAGFVLNVINGNAASDSNVAICDTVDNNSVAAYDGTNVDSSDANTRHCVYTGNPASKKDKKSPDKDTTENPTVNPVVTDTTPDTTVNPVVENPPQNPTDENPACNGNPGNDKCVGNSGENPNGKGTMILDGVGIHGNQGVNHPTK
jgi:hypothetical protein